MFQLQCPRFHHNHPLSAPWNCFPCTELSSIQTCTRSTCVNICIVGGGRIYFFPQWLWYGCARRRQDDHYFGAQCKFKRVSQAPSFIAEPEEDIESMYTMGRDWFKRDVVDVAYNYRVGEAKRRVCSLSLGWHIVQGNWDVSVCVCASACVFTLCAGGWVTDNMLIVRIVSRRRW